MTTCEMCEMCEDLGYYYTTVIRHVKRRQTNGKPVIRCDVEKLRVTCDCEKGDQWMETHGLKFVG